MAKAAITAPLVVDEITLDGKRVQVQSVDLPLERVKLDPRNPRIANTVALSLTEEGEALQRKLEALLWEDGDVRDLVPASADQQGPSRTDHRSAGRNRRRRQLSDSRLSKAPSEAAV